MNPSVIRWTERLIWILIYAGLFAVVLGLASGGVHRIAGWSLGVVGAVAVVTGIVLIWVRSRMHEEPSGAESKSPSEGTKT